MSRRRAKPLTTEGVKTFERVCEAPGCRLAGEFRAPFSRDKLDQYRWFCLEHVRDYNKKWDYFRGLDADEIEKQLKAQGDRPTAVEGFSNAEWILMDYGACIIHIFSEKAREYYGLDRLYRDARRLEISSAQ